MQDKRLRILMVGAHPDDCDVLAGGTAIKFRKEGHIVRFISATNGDTGHHEKGGGCLANIRAREAANAGKTAGIDYVVLDIHSNEIEADIHTRKRMISLFREFMPDIIFTHRPYDYHPDHRRTSMLVQDSSHALIIPDVCPLTPPLKQIPIIMYMNDLFKKPYELIPDVVVDIGDVFEEKVRLYGCHESQVYEWLPWVDGTLGEVPQEYEKRLYWLGQKQYKRDGITADRFLQALILRYGEEKTIKVAEVFELCEYGRKVSREELQTIFPF